MNEEQNTPDLSLSNQGEIPAPVESIATVKEMADNPVSQVQSVPAPPPQRTVAEVYAPVYNPNIPDGLKTTSFYNQAERVIRERQTITDDSLRNDPVFLDAARIIAKRDYPDDWEDMDNEKLGTFFLTKLNRVNYNVSTAISDSFEFEDAPDLDKAAYAYGLKMYEDKEVSAEGVAGATIAMVTDYINIGAMFATGGTALLARGVAGKSITGKLLGSLMRNPRKAIAAESAVMGGGASVVEQDLQKKVKLKDEIDTGEVLLNTAVGAVLPKALEEGGKAVAKGVSKTVDFVKGQL